MAKYYDGAKLLSMKDINGNRPEIFICTTNRTGGKTTYFGRLLVNRFIDKHEKFCLLYRYNYEVDECASKFFKDIGGLFFNGHTMEDKRKARGVYSELYFDGELCGYAMSINNANQVKKFSHFFSDVSRMLFDEFQSETGNYCPNEVAKLISIHTSIARGNGEQVRYVPIYMLANPVSMINPYYTELGISSRLDGKTRFLRGDGFVMEQGYVESAADAQKTSAFNRAFSANKYTNYSAQGVYLNDSTAFIERPAGSSRYIVTIKYNGKLYGVREFAESGIIYCDDRPDMSFKDKITVTTEDHDVNFVMLRRYDLFIMNLRYYFERGSFRFKNLACKEAILQTLSY